MRGDSFVRVEDMSAMLAHVAQAEAEHAGVVPDIDLSSARLASELKYGAQRSVGLLPAGRADALTVATQLGLALGLITEAMVVVVLPEREPPDPSASAGASPYAAWLGPSVAALAPARVAGVGQKATGIGDLLDFLATRADSYGHLLIDLTGCERPGELYASLSLLDGVIVVGHAGRVTEPELRETIARIPQHLCVGVLLHE